MISRADQLKSLADQFPAAQQKQAAAAGAAQTFQTQSALGSMPSQGVGNIVPASQQAGATQVSTAMQSGLQQQQQAVNKNVQVGQLGLEARGQQLQGEAASRGLASNDQYQKYATQLNSLDQQTKNTLLDNQLKFNTNQAGQKQLNERQLMDYAVTKAKSDVDLKQYQQAAEETWAKKLYTIQVAQQRIQTALDQQYQKSKQDQDQALIQQLTQAKVQADKNIATQQADARNKMAAWQAAGTVVGAVAGSFGGPAGAAAGAAIGGGLASAGALFT